MFEVVDGEAVLDVRELSDEELEGLAGGGCIVASICTPSIIGDLPPIGVLP